MSERTLRHVLERLNSDEKFRADFKNPKKWGHIVHELNLSPTELAAIATQDEDALRRLAGAEPMIAGQGLGFYTTNLLCSLLCFCFPFVTFLDTPQSKRHCGTGSGGTAVGCCESEP